MAPQPLSQTLYVVQHATTVDREAIVWLSGTAPGAASDVPYRYGCFALLLHASSLWGTCCSVQSFARRPPYGPSFCGGGCFFAKCPKCCGIFIMTSFLRAFAPCASDARQGLSHEAPPAPAAHQWLRRDGFVDVKVRARLRAASVQVWKRVLSAEQIALGSLRSSSNTLAVPGPGFHVSAGRRWRVQKAQGTTRV